MYLAKASPRRLLAKPDKMNNTGRTKSPPVDHKLLPSYPALRSCDAPIDMILPDLISSPMYVTDHTPHPYQVNHIHHRARSLGKLFHAREIRTIGNLASLPENQVGECVRGKLLGVPCSVGEVVTHTTAKAADTEDHFRVF